MINYNIDPRTETLFALENFLSQIGANESVLDDDELLESALQYVAMDNGKIKVIDPDNLE